jgi:serine/threonine protein kinase
LNPTNIICKEGKDNHKIKICDFETSRQFGDIIQVFPPVPSDDTQSMRSYDHHQQYSSGSTYQVFSQFTQFTLGYTCPELLLCYEDDEKSQNNVIEVPAYFNQDIFSMGCILYFLLNNSKPLYSSLEELEESVSLEKGFEYKIRKDIEDDVTADLILKCVNKKPNGRPTIEEVLDNAYFKANVEKSHSVNSKNSHDSIKSDNVSRNSHDSAKSESLNGSNGSSNSSEEDER